MVKIGTGISVVAAELLSVRKHIVISNRVQYVDGQSNQITIWNGNVDLGFHLLLRNCIPARNMITQYVKQCEIKFFTNILFRVIEWVDSNIHIAFSPNCADHDTNGRKLYVS